MDCLQCVLAGSVLAAGLVYIVMAWLDRQARGNAGVCAILRKALQRRR